MLQRLSQFALVLAPLLVTGCISSGTGPVALESTPAEATVDPTLDTAPTPCGDLKVIRPRADSVATDTTIETAKPEPLLAFDCGDGKTTL